MRKTKMYYCVALMLAALTSKTTAQSNYASQANNVEYQGGLPEQTVLDGKVTKLDELSPVIFLNRTKAELNCAAGSMQVELKFKEKFYGIAYADFDRNSACQVLGKGALSYKLELPLKGCGTKQEPLRVFTNNIVVRFHPGLEMEGDEVITIVCRYPPPLVPPVAPVPLLQSPPPAAAAPPLGGAHILFIICAILFLTLLLLGLGVSYLCLRRRALPPPRRLIDDGNASLVSKESVAEVKIPRAHPAYLSAAASQSSGSIPSEYPSETPSEAEVTHHNQAFILDESYQSEGYGDDTLSMSNDMSHETVVERHYRRPPPPPPSPPVTVHTERMLSEHMREESVRTVSPPQMQLYSQVSRAHRMQEWETGRSYMSEMTAPRSVPELTDGTHARIFNLKRELHEHEHEEEEILALPETPIMPARKPEITSHIVDDVFLKTVTEKKTIEDIERHRRLVTEYKPVPKPPTNWDVTIRTHPNLEPNWENFSDISSASGLTLTPKMERQPLSVSPQQIGNTGPDLFSPELVGHVRAGVMPPMPELPAATNPLYREDDIPAPPPPHPQPHNWQQLTRVLKSNETHEEEERLSYSDRVRWRELLSYESSLRQELTQASSREEYTRISVDDRFSHLYSPHKWDVIIRILAPPTDKPKSRYRKKQEWENRSRRSSLPTLYEYDSEVGSVRAQPHTAAYADMRSVSEVMVEWGRQEWEGGAPHDSESEADPHGWSLQRSISQPSLARSGSELIENSWAQQSPETTPTPGRRMESMSTFKSNEVRTFQASRGWQY